MHLRAITQIRPIAWMRKLHFKLLPNLSRANELMCEYTTYRCIIRCCNNMVQHNAILYTAQQWLRLLLHDDVIKWKLFPHYCPFVQGIHRFLVNSPHKGHWRGALMLSLICTWINNWVNNGEAGDLRCYHSHCEVTLMARKQLSAEMFQQSIATVLFDIRWPLMHDISIH